MISQFQQSAHINLNITHVQHYLQLTNKCNKTQQYEICDIKIEI